MKKVKEAIEQVNKVLEILKDMEEQKKTENQARLVDLQPGDRFNTELGKFIVLDHDKEHGWTKVIQENFFEEDVKFDGNCCDYTKSDLRGKFDGEITGKYTELFGDALVEHEVELKSVDMQDYGKFTCKVRPITFDEARQYNDLIVNTELNGYYWTCNAWSTKERGWEHSVAVVSPFGRISHRGFGFSRGVRPFCILKSDLFVSCVEA